MPVTWPMLLLFQFPHTRETYVIVSFVGGRAFQFPHTRETSHRLDVGGNGLVSIPAYTGNIMALAFSFVNGRFQFPHTRETYAVCPCLQAGILSIPAYTGNIVDSLVEL